MPTEGPCLALPVTHPSLENFPFSSFLGPVITYPAFKPSGPFEYPSRNPLVKAGGSSCEERPKQFGLCP